MAVVMVAMLAFGGTYAYFTATSKAYSKDITTGYVSVSADGALASLVTSNVMPKQKIAEAGAIKVVVSTSEEAGNYVAIKFTITAEDKNGDAIQESVLAAAGLSADSIVASTGNGWYESSTQGIYVYGKSATEAVAQKGNVVVNSAAFTFDATDNFVEGSTLSTNRLMEATITITIEARSIQSTELAGTAAVEQLVGLFTTYTAPDAE